MDEHRQASINPHIFDMMVSVGFSDVNGALISLDRYIKTQMPAWMENEPIDPVSERDFIRALDAVLQLVAIADRNGLQQLPFIGGIPGISRRAGTSPGLIRILKALDHVRDRLENRLHPDFDHPFRVREPFEDRPAYTPDRDNKEKC